MLACKCNSLPTNNELIKVFLYFKRNVTLTENSSADFLMASSVEEIYRSWKKKTESCCKMFIALHWERKTFLNNILNFLVLNKRFLRTIFSLSEGQIVDRIYNKHFSVFTENEVCKWLIEEKNMNVYNWRLFQLSSDNKRSVFLFCFVLCCACHLYHSCPSKFLFWNKHMQLLERIKLFGNTCNCSKE